MPTKTKRKVKIRKAKCVWCKKMIRLKGNRLVGHPSRAAANWVYKIEPSRCPGSGTDPKDWKPEPVKTQPKKKTKKRKAKR